MRAPLFAALVRRVAAGAAAAPVARPPRARLSRARRRALRPVPRHASRRRSSGCTPSRSARRARRRRSSMRLRRAYPDATVLLTHMTATGRATGRALFGDGVLQAWLPYDAPFAVRRFLAHFKPCAGLIMETELWPNLVALAREAGVPIYLVNARMSERSARLYAAFPALTRPMLARAGGRRGADRRRCRATRRARRARRGRHGKSQIRRRADERRRGAGPRVAGRASANRAPCGSPHRRATARRR